MASYNTSTRPHNDNSITHETPPQTPSPQIYKDHSPASPVIRHDAYNEANGLFSSFFGKPLPLYSAEPENNNNSSTEIHSPINERVCMGGHKETIFGLSFSPDGKYLATASQDSTVQIWKVENHSLVASLTDGVDVKYECLRVAWHKVEYDNNEDGERYLLASSGADGVVRLWSGYESVGRLEWRCVGILDHYFELKKCINDDASDDENEENDEGDDETDERPQIYALQFVNIETSSDENYLLTSANDSLYVWKIINESVITSNSDMEGRTKVRQRKILSHSSVTFTHLDPTTGVPNRFGGARNPNNEIYVFDASYCESNGLVGAALSDGTCRILPLSLFGMSDNADHCVLSLPPSYFPETRGGHLTGLSWDMSGSRLATCIASGRVVLWSIQIAERGGTHIIVPSCISILEGGHAGGRPLFGVKYVGKTKEDLLLTWGVDGKVCVWDSYSMGNVASPLCTLISLPSYPIYTLDFIQKNDDSEKSRSHIAVGGGSEGGFLGMHVYIYDI